MSGDISRAVPINAQAIRQLQQLAQEEVMMQVESEEDFEQYVETSPFVLYQRFRPMLEIKAAQARKPEAKDQVAEKKILSIEEIGQAAARFERNNDEIKSRTLLILRSSITNEDTPEEILNKVLKVYTDHSLADEALDFLIETTSGDVKKTIQIAKEHLNQNFAREIKAGRNMGIQSREFSKEGLGSPTSLRDLYRDITGTPRDPLKLFDELTDKFRYEKLKTAITFLLHSLGADLKAKGPSISRAELKRLLDETRSLQGILGVFRFFQSRMHMMQRQFISYNLLFPTRLSFEVLAKIFIKILAERYMNAEKIFQFAKVLGLSEEAAAQIIVLTQYRDAIKQIAPRYYRNAQHRDELIKSLLEALEQLEDELEEEDEDA